MISKDKGFVAEKDYMLKTINIKVVSHITILIKFVVKYDYLKLINNGKPHLTGTVKRAGRLA